MSSRIGVGYGSVNSPVTKAIRYYNKEKDEKTEKYRQAPRGTNMESVPEIPPVHYEPYSKKGMKVASIVLTVIVIILSLILIGYVIAYFIKGKSINSLFKDYGGDVCSECKCSPCVCGPKNPNPATKENPVSLLGGSNVAFRNTINMNDDMEDLSYENKSFAQRHNLLI